MRTAIGFNATYTRSYEFLDEPFQIASDVAIPVGGYRFQDVQLLFALGQRRPLSGGLSIQHGSFFSGTKTSVDLGVGGGNRGGRVELTPQLSVEPSVSFNWVDLPEGRFHGHKLVTARTDLHGHASDVRQRAAAVQLEQQFPGSESALALGVSAGQ